MKFLILVSCGLSFALLTGAQTGQPSKNAEAQVSAGSTSDIVPLPSIKLLTAAQAAGKKLFVQKCSVCHLPALPSYAAYGPVVDKAVVADRGDEAIRFQIMHGSARMPGFQYTLSTVECDQVLDYLKTLDIVKKD